MAVTAKDGTCAMYLGTRPRSKGLAVRHGVERHGWSKSQSMVTLNKGSSDRSTPLQGIARLVKSVHSVTAAMETPVTAVD